MIAVFAPIQVVGENVLGVTKNARLLSQPGLTTCSFEENEMADESVVEQNELVQVPGYESLFVSRAGEVFRMTGGQMDLVKTKLAVGYKSFRQDGKSLYVHHVMLEAFVGPRPFKADACHINDVRTDNRIENLRWGTHQENAIDAVRNGRIQHGESHKWAKVTRQQVDDIRARYLAGEKQKDLATEFGLSLSGTSAICRGYSWSSLSEHKSERRRAGKLRVAQVAEIKRCLSDKTKTQSQLAKEYGVSRGAICDIAIGRSYSDVQVAS